MYVCVYMYIYIYIYICIYTRTYIHAFMPLPSFRRFPTTAMRIKITGITNPSIDLRRQTQHVRLAVFVRTRLVNNHITAITLLHAARF